MTDEVQVAPWRTVSFMVGAVEVFATRLDAGADAVRSSEAVLSDTDRQRANLFTFDRDRRRFVVGRAHLRELLARRLGVRPESVKLTCGARGKPAIAPGSTDLDLRFNVSHAGDIAAYAIANGREVGIDIEAVRAVPNADGIASRFFSRQENEAYRALDPSDRPLGFLNCWTRKEAFVKALGDGLGYPFDRFDVSLAPGDPAKVLRVGSTAGDGCGWHLESPCLAPGLVAALVVETMS
jgi:4'-phosphopantetheinyl transferase